MAPIRVEYMGGVSGKLHSQGGTVLDFNLLQLLTYQIVRNNFHRHQNTRSICHGIFVLGSRINPTTGLSLSQQFECKVAVNDSHDFAGAQTIALESSLPYRTATIDDSLPRIRSWMIYQSDDF